MEPDREHADRPVGLGLWRGERDAGRLERRDATGSTRSRTRASRYDPSTDSWTALPNAQFPRYRAGGSCGFYKIGGSSAGFSPIGGSEKLSELDDCAEFTDVPWLSESPTSGTINPGGHTTVQVTVDTHGLIPGNVYQAITDVPHEQRPAPEPGGSGAADRAGVGAQLRRRRLHERRRRAVVGRSGVHSCQRGGVRPVTARRRRARARRSEGRLTTRSTRTRGSAR